MDFQFDLCEYLPIAFSSPSVVLSCSSAVLKLPSWLATLLLFSLVLFLDVSSLFCKNFSWLKNWNNQNQGYLRVCFCKDTNYHQTERHVSPPPCEYLYQTIGMLLICLPLASNLDWFNPTALQLKILKCDIFGFLPVHTSYGVMFSNFLVEQWFLI